MVWFQCEACGEELKKPKLPNHFRNCSAHKLSCIDCGVTFDQQTVQSHTQCITEAEKYGPKGQGPIAYGTATKAKQEKPKLDVDINVGLSNRYPWFCSLCNTKATSQQALLLHGDGKKHRAKVRAHIAKQQPSEEAGPKSKETAENNTKSETPDAKSASDKKENIPSNGAPEKDNSSAENGDLVGAKKRKMATTNDDSTDRCLTDLSNGIATKVDAQEMPKQLKKAKVKPEVKGALSKEKVKWKKVIASVLKAAPDGSLKMKKLRKSVFKSLRESGICVDDTDFSTILEHKVNSSSKFVVDGKYVKLAA